MFVQVGDTNPGCMSMTCGGVARNIAECMSRLGVPPQFLSAVGRDRSGQLILSDLQERGMVRIIKTVVLSGCVPCMYAVN